MKTRFRSLRSERGSALIVAMFFAAIIEISILSYLGLSRTGMTISNRALYNNGAMNLAENGLEEAMYSINKMIADDTYDWTDNGWTAVGTTDMRRQLPSSGTYAFDQGATGIVRVYVYNHNGVSGAPMAVARSTITLAGNSGAVIEKWVLVQLRKTSAFSNGLVAKNSILFKGNNASVDSWNSDPTNNGSFTAYNAATNRRDNGSVGSISVSTDAVLVKQADVWGYVKTGGVDPTSSVGNNGSVLGASSVYDPLTWTKNTVDPSRVSTDFSASFPNKELPETPTPSIGSITAIGTYGTAGASTTILASDISLSGNNAVVTFQGNVTLVLTAAQAIQITGNHSGIAVAANSSLKIYTDGNIDLTGQGITNTSGDPDKVRIFGTKTSGVQDIKIAGGGSLAGVIYAPFGDVTINGDGAVWGSVVANNITLSGNANFHYDESLANLDTGDPYRVSTWKELTSSTDRNTYSPKLSF